MGGPGLHPEADHGPEPARPGSERATAPKLVDARDHYAVGEALGQILVLAYSGVLPSAVDAARERARSHPSPLVRLGFNRIVAERDLQHFEVPTSP